MINVDANLKNWLIKVYAIKDMLGIPVTASVNLINHGEYLDYENGKCRKKLVHKSAEKCTENINIATLSEIAIFKVYVLAQFVLSWVW